MSSVAENADNRVRKPVVQRAGLVIASGLLASGVAGAAYAEQIKTVFVIAMENHNWVQPGSQTSPGQIFGNPAALYINSLVTPGNPNAAQTSYASNYLNAGAGIHPSEPNYIWSEAGSNLGVFNDNDPFQVPGAQIKRRPIALATICNKRVRPGGHIRRIPTSA
jgi:hypothetical protein